MSDALIDPRARRLQRLGTAFAVVAYAFLLVPILVVLPIAFGSTEEISFPPASYSLDLFRQFFASQSWVGALAESFKVATITTLIVMLAGVPAGYALARHDFIGKHAISGALLSTLVIPHIVTGLGLYLYFSYLRFTGSTLALVLGHVVSTLPYAVVMIVAGVQKLDRNLEFCAELMGASKARMFFTVVLPQLTPSLISAALFAFLMSFDEFIIAWFVSGPDTMTLPVKMYTAIQWEISPVIAAVSALLTGLSMVICLVSLGLKGSRVNEGTR